MSWRDELRRVTLPDGRKLIGASFRGVPFLVDVAERNGGRRIVNHEFPGRDDNFVDDLGRRARTFHVDGHVIGADYIAQRDNLLSALEDTAGAGELLHPYYGVKRCISGGFSVRESVVDGGMATFSIEFAEAPAQGIAPTAVADLPGQVDASADAAAAAAGTAFTTSFDPSGLPSHALASASAAVTAMSEELRAKLAPAIRDEQELAEFNGEIHVLTSETSALVAEPALLLEKFSEALTGLVTTAENAPGAMVDALLAAYAVDLGEAVPETTSTRQRERANQIAIQGMLRQLTIIEAARTAPAVPYASIDEAEVARDALLAAIDAEAATAVDSVYTALVDLRATLVRAVPDETLTARIVTVTRQIPIPSILLAYQLYGSVDEEADLIARNKIRHPGFIAGAIKALTNV